MVRETPPLPCYARFFPSARPRNRGFRKVCRGLLQAAATIPMRPEYLPKQCEFPRAPGNSQPPAGARRFLRQTHIPESSLPKVCRTPQRAFWLQSGGFRRRARSPGPHGSRLSFRPACRAARQSGARTEQVRSRVPSAFLAKGKPETLLLASTVSFGSDSWPSGIASGSTRREHSLFPVLLFSQPPSVWPPEWSDKSGRAAQPESTVQTPHPPKPARDLEPPRTNPQAKRLPLLDLPRRGTRFATKHSSGNCR